MRKKVLILHGSQKKCGNTGILSDEFMRGAIEAGHSVLKIELKEKNFGDCLGCGICQTNSGQCVQKDDMTYIYNEMIESEILVFASPVYFYTWTALMKRLIDRTFAVENILHDKTFYLVSTGAAPEEKYMKIMIDGFLQYVSCFRSKGNRVGGMSLAME